MVGASARYSCLHTPVETVTSPRLVRRNSLHAASAGAAKALYPLLPSYSPTWARLRWAPSWVRTMVGCADQHFSGSGYSTPKVSTVTFFITWGVRGLSL